MCHIPIDRLAHSTTSCMHNTLWQWNRLAVARDHWDGGGAAVRVLSAAGGMAYATRKR